MYELFKSLLIMLLMLLAITWRRLYRLSVAAFYWANGGAVRKVRRDAQLRRTWSVREGELCLCDVLGEHGVVFRTLARGNALPDPSMDAASRKRIHGSIMSIEPTSRISGDPTVCAARDFLMERCAGFAETAATAAEVVRLMEAHVGSGYHSRLTIVLPDFTFVETAGDCPAMPIDL